MLYDGTLIFLVVAVFRVVVVVGTGGKRGGFSIRLRPNGGPSVGSARPTRAPSPRTGYVGRPRALPVVSEIVKEKKKQKRRRKH